MSESIDLSHPRTAFLLESLVAASRLASEIQESSLSDPLEKEDRSPVTVADFSVQAVIARRLQKAFPGEDLVAEESSRLLHDNPHILGKIQKWVSSVEGSMEERDILRWIDRGSAKPGSHFWTLDPVDGTKGFLRGDQFAVALAWIEEGEVLFSGLGCPRLDSAQEAEGGRILLAIRGGGCWQCSLQGKEFERCRVSDCRSLARVRVLRSVEKGHTNLDQFSRLMEKVGTEVEPVLMDSQAKYAALALGWGDAVVRLQSRPDYREKIWDQAAGSLVVEEAGGRVTDQLGQPLDFTRGTRLENNRGAVASNSLIHDQLIALLREVGRGS